MVWGMNLPSGFGEFWPDGQFELDAKTRKSGWSERLRFYYLEQNPEEQRRLYDYGDNHVGYGAAYYGGYVCGKFICELGTRQYPDRPPVSPIEPHEPPQYFGTLKGYKALGSLIKLNDRIVAVDEALKAIIERLEPDVHGFFPIEIRMPRGKVYPAQYYTLAIGQYFDSFSLENSKDCAYRSNGDYGYLHEETKAGVTGLAFSKAIFGHAHLWRERGFREWLTCLSDELRAEIDGAGLRIPKHYKMKEV